MIRIQNHDTIIDIIEKMEQDDSEELLLHFPVWHPIVHNKIALRVIKSKAKHKKLTVLTHDALWKNLMKKAGIHFSKENMSRELRSKNSKNLLKYNFSIIEYIKIELNKYKEEIQNIFKRKHTSYSQKEHYEKIQNVFQVHFIFITCILSLIIFVFLYYFSISKTQIYISPEIKVKREALNFIFTENTTNSILWWNKNIKINKYTTTVSLTEVFWSTDIDIGESQLSEGNILIENTTSEAITLIANTRFSTKDGVEFVIANNVTIPAAVEDNFWTLSSGKTEVKATAKTKDRNGKFVWTRWNIEKGIRLTVPWLWEEYENLVYATSINAFSGWSEEFKKKISESDIVTAEKIFTEKLKSEAFKKAQSEIRQSSELNNTQYKILWSDDAISYENLVIDSSDASVWALKDSFIISWSVDLTVYTFSTEAIIQKLKTVITEKKLDGVEKISHIDDESLRFSQKIYSSSSPFEIKGTYEIEYFTLHDFSNEDSSYIRNLKNKILWLHEDEAYKILLNDPKISSVEIKIRPFFVNHISNIYNNIVINIEEK